jgi:hypothetical protein
MIMKKEKLNKSEKKNSAEVLAEILAYLKTNTKALSESIGLSSPQRMYNITYGTAGFSKDIANKIIRKHPELNISFILSGEGQILDVSKQKAEAKKSSVSVGRDNNGTVNHSGDFEKIIKAMDKQLSEKDKQIRELLAIIKSKK